MPVIKKIFNEKSWRVATRNIEAWVTEAGGHLGPVTFKLGRREVQPYHVAPWWNEQLPPDTPPVIRVLRGDFFCMPFGGNARKFRREAHAVHGEAANAKWKLRLLDQYPEITTLDCYLQTQVRRGRVDKHIELRAGHPAIYCRHTISGMSGPMTIGHHAMLRFPDQIGSGVISTSKFVHGQVYVEPTELPDNRGYSMLKPAAMFDSLARVPTITGETTDVSRYPARRGFEDLLMLVADPKLQVAWTAVVFPKERYAWFAIRDPEILRNTIFWISNGGRHYPPWNGRHVNVMGLEETTSFFHPGLSESAAENELSRRGFPTIVKLDPKQPTVVNYVMAVSEVPADFDRVAEINIAQACVELVSSSGKKVPVAVDCSFLWGGK